MALVETEILLLNPNRYPEAAARRVRPWLLPLLAAVAPDRGSLAVRFCGERAMRRINRDFRGRDYATDVLSFPGDADAATDHVGDPGSLGDPSDHRGGHLGDILIAVPVARRQAAAAGHAAEREIRVLLLHGVLHCLGYDHEVDDGAMERLERRLRRRWIDAAPAVGKERVAGAAAVRIAVRARGGRRRAG
jgi:probable rRNA maturation factor